MCRFFSCIVTEKGKIFFCEKDSHEKIIVRLNTKEDITRIKVINGEYRLDTQTIPEWYERTASKVEQQVMTLYSKIKTRRNKYDKIYDSIREISNIEGVLKEIEVRE